MGWTGCFPTWTSLYRLAAISRRAAMKAKAESNTASLAVIGVDIGKDVFEKLPP